MISIVFRQFYSGVVNTDPVAAVSMLRAFGDLRAGCNSFTVGIAQSASNNVGIPGNI